MILVENKMSSKHNERGNTLYECALYCKPRLENNVYAQYTTHCAIEVLKHFLNVNLKTHFKHNFYMFALCYMIVLIGQIYYF